MFTERIEIGLRIYNPLPYCGRGVVFAIHGEQDQASCQIMKGVISSGGRAMIDVVWEAGRESRGIPESLLRGSVQWKVETERPRADGDEIANLREAARRRESKEKQAREDRASAKRAGIERLRHAPEYAGLLQLSPENRNSLTTAAKNIRAELKRAFPGACFKVRSDRFSGGDSIDVSWIDGPTFKQVEAITSKYQDGHFDGMEDMYHHGDEAWNVVFGDAKYVHEQRRLSVSFLESVRAEMGYSAEQVPVESHNDGEGYIDSWSRGDNRNPCEQVQKAASERSA